MVTDGVDQRRRFLQDLGTERWTMSELCARYGISRPTGYLWRARYEVSGLPGLELRSSAPHACPHQTTAAIEAQVVAARRRYGWGAKKLRQRLVTARPAVRWPARSTINDILDRHGLLEKRRRRRPWTHPGRVPLAATAPNDVWPADFKGQFKTGDGRYCYPLTVTDLFSRRVLACQGLLAIRAADARALFVRLFRAHGLPRAIRTDNGVPFAGPGLQGLSALNVWWLQLEIVHQRIRPGCPQENGSHERMHRELKRETTCPSAATGRAQQQRFDRFRHRYNAERPHEALDGHTPDRLWAPSPRPYEERPRTPHYAAHLEVRRVSRGGTISWQGQLVFLSEVLRGEDVALEEVDEDCWNIVYYTTLLARWDGRTQQLTSAHSLNGGVKQAAGLL
jgi:transposase InsO family protein